MLNHFPTLAEPIQQALFALVRWIHIVCTTLLVGGTLFYEFVIPKAIEDLKEESQLAVLGKTRWFFRQVVILSTILLVLSGALSVWFYMPMYSGVFQPVQYWLGMHIALGLLAMGLGFMAMARSRSSRHPLTWLRINFVILLIAMFLGSVARQIRLSVQDRIEHDNASVFGRYAHPELPPP